MTFNLADYPPDWKAFSRRIRFVRAAGRCECLGECGLHGKGMFHPAARRCVEMNGKPARWARGRIMLTVAHLNYPGGPCQCDPLCSIAKHVKAMCARCHLRIDRERHAYNATKKRDITRLKNSTLKGKP